MAGLFEEVLVLISGLDIKISCNMPLIIRTLTLRKEISALENELVI